MVSVPDTQQGVYTAEDVAKLLRVSARTARRAMRQAPLKRFVVRRGRRLYITAANFERAFDAEVQG